MKLSDAKKAVGTKNAKRAYSVHVNVMVNILMIFVLPLLTVLRVAFLGILSACGDSRSGSYGSCCYAGSSPQFCMRMKGSVLSNYSVHVSASANILMI